MSHKHEPKKPTASRQKPAPPWDRKNPAISKAPAGAQDPPRAQLGSNKV